MIVYNNKTGSIANASKPPDRTIPADTPAAVFFVVEAIAADEDAVAVVLALPLPVLAVDPDVAELPPPLLVVLPEVVVVADVEFAAAAFSNPAVMVTGTKTISSPVNVAEVDVLVLAGTVSQSESVPVAMLAVS